MVMLVVLVKVRVCHKDDDVGEDINNNKTLVSLVRVEGVQSSALKTFQFPQRDRIKDYV